MSELSSRTPQEIFQSHGKALLAEDLDGIVANYAPDAAFITPTGVRHGRDGVREGFAQLFADLPHATWDLTIQTFEGDVLFLEWSADSDSNQARHGVDTFVFRNGLIQTQTVRYALAPKS
ncbi:nuclear transport factor 2 family protein [Streptomyces kaniharaensis]|uniref:Nuclear transport factor 2 family protein n=1 Tax=Streptomyces kaniharaensis TaxID=212423 RepID=A0A6N7L0I6_9ACTN|nr:nuclear transport factor 2 family protein [Streptomyces kaniharaensis]MQS15684.1 nuclear transport factor 2 family protein [Streptomyces kaniharaensis]